MACGDCIKGAVGLAKAALGLDAAAADVVRVRRDLCRDCPDATRTAGRGLTTRSRCRRCRCFIAAKTLLVSEACPAGKW